MKESSLNKKAQDLLTANGASVVKTVVTNRAGTGDIIACVPNLKGLGRYCMLEGKLSYNKASALQKSKRNETIKAGGLWIELRSMEDVNLILTWVQKDYIQPLEDPRYSLKTRIL